MRKANYGWIDLTVLPKTREADMSDEPVLKWPNGDKTLAETFGDWLKAQRECSEIGRRVLAAAGQTNLGLRPGDWAGLAETLNFLAVETNTVLGAVAILTAEVDRIARRTNTDLHARYPFLFH